MEREMSKATIRISSLVREEIKDQNKQVGDFLEDLVKRFNQEVQICGSDEIMLELIKFRTKRKAPDVEDKRNAKDFMATLSTDEKTYGTFKNTVENMGMSVSEALRRLIYREIELSKKSRLN